MAIPHTLVTARARIELGIPTMSVCMKSATSSKGSVVTSNSSCSSGMEVSFGWLVQLGVTQRTVQTVRPLFGLVRALGGINTGLRYLGWTILLAHGHAKRLAKLLEDQEVLVRVPLGEFPHS